MVVRGGLRLRSGRQLSKDRTVSGTLLLENVRSATNAPSSIATPGINDQAHHGIHVTVARMARFSYTLDRVIGRRVEQTRVPEHSPNRISPSVVGWTGSIVRMLTRLWRVAREMCAPSL